MQVQDKEHVVNDAPFGVVDDAPAEALEIEALPVPSRAEPKIPMWAWGVIAFGAYKLLSKRR